MTRQEQLDLIRAACIEANPSDITLHEQHSWQGLQIKRKYGRPIRLADVLLAAGNLCAVDGTGTLFRLRRVLGDEWIFDAHNARWNLRKDDLAEQGDDLLAILADHFRQRSPD